jgi:hypothetical protein
MKMKKLVILILFMGTISLYGQNNQSISDEFEWFMTGFLPLNEESFSLSGSWIFQVGELNRTQLRLIRNTIYARHGYIFNSIDLKEYFSQFNWYIGTKTNVDGELTADEISIIEFIRQMEANYPSIVPEELIGLWAYGLPDDWWSYHNPASHFFSNIMIRFFSNGIFDYTFVNAGKPFYYAGFWSLEKNTFSLKFYFVGVDGSNYIFDPNIHHEYWTNNFEGNISFYNRNVDRMRRVLWECNFQKNSPSWKKIEPNPKYVDPG